MTLIRVAHSPDSDDAFMFYALAKGLIDTGRYEFEHVLSDIETLNREAHSGTYEVTGTESSLGRYPAGEKVLLGAFWHSRPMFSLPALVGGSIATLQACRRAHCPIVSLDCGSVFCGLPSSRKTGFFIVAALRSIGQVPQKACDCEPGTIALYIEASLLHVPPSWH